MIHRIGINKKVNFRQIVSSSATVARLEQRVEDLEDLRDLETAVIQNAKASDPLAELQEELDLD